MALDYEAARTAVTVVDPKLWASACTPFLEQLVRVRFAGRISGEGDILGQLLEVNERDRQITLRLVDRPDTQLGGRLVLDFDQLRSIEAA